MAAKEAKARIKINKLLEEAGWRFFDSEFGPANVILENNIKLTQKLLDEYGEDFEKSKNGYIDFLLLDDRGYPLIVLEAKSEDKNPLVGKEQARKYAKAQNCRFVILSNGNLHYLWDLNHGNPYVITKFPEPSSIKIYKDHQPNPQKLVDERLLDDYIALTQLPNYFDNPAFKDESLRKDFIEKNKLKFLRSYQLRAVDKLQKAVQAGSNRFLFEMATGTGKTLIAAAIIKLFLRTGNAKRVLFLVDRLELEDQANKAFVNLLKNDYKSVIYKENRQDWRKSEIVVTTIQSLLFNNKYQKFFSPTDFDLVISDEAHRSIGGNSRAVFEYFIGYKLGLTATPKDYLKKIDKAGQQVRDPREVERRILLDTYRTFGCESGQPTFRYSLIDGVRDGYLINPVVVDARTDVTTQLLSDEGYSVITFREDGEKEEEEYYQRDFEKKFFSEDTNKLFCKTFLDNALLDPVTKEIGKSIIFSVSQNHAAKLTQILNEFADQMYPGKYNSDFAIQVTSQIPDAQQFTINFANNNLSGSGNFLPTYKTSKTRVCVTVGMMTTGYDCTDILNLCLMRPIFSPTDFIQIKGRGTRKHNFLEQLFDNDLKEQIAELDKTKYKLFDFFANCEYFEEKYNYDEVLKLPRYPRRTQPTGNEGPVVIERFENFDPDKLIAMEVKEVGLSGMKIDRMFFEQFEDRIRSDKFIQEYVEKRSWDSLIEYLNQNIMNKPEYFYTIEKLRKAAGVDRRISLREVVEKALGLIPGFKSKDQLLEEEFEKFILDRKPDKPKDIQAMKYFFKAYITSSQVRDIIESRDLTQLNVNAIFTIKDYKAVPKEWREIIPEYIKDYVPLNQFMM
ncbi:MAG: DEAD/DEAH box helicase family protein [Ignavibacterium sp.]|jgi:type I restriction enzyme R subunit|nr:DEAD/DEAH box helicase family protein [Ignavibacterium sp.]